jgi:hypothetical protein
MSGQCYGSKDQSSPLRALDQGQDVSIKRRIALFLGVPVGERQLWVQYAAERCFLSPDDNCEGDYKE